MTTPTRLLASLLALGGCSLYFGPGAGVDNPPPPPEDSGPIPPPPPPPPGGVPMARCEDGNLYRVMVPTFAPDQPGHGAGQLYGHCSGECRSAAVECADSTCAHAADTLCGAPASLGASCELAGTACTSGSTLECPQSTTCGYALAGASCACASDGTYHCTPETAAPSIQAALVGKWQGMVTPPSFTQPYPVSLWIYPDGTYWAEAPQMIAFYYGGDGPHPERAITILSASPTQGAWADIGIYFGGSPANVGALSALTVDATHLRFTFYASWFGCGQPFFFELTRV